MVSKVTGMAIHEALATPVKSTSPMHTATIYPTATPESMGTSFISPRQSVSTSMAVISDTKASSQWSLAMLTALPESERPMRMMTGPITTGGKSLSSSLRPCHLTRALITK